MGYKFINVAIAAPLNDLAGIQSKAQQRFNRRRILTTSCDETSG
jgi:hypothetical protein